MSPHSTPERQLRYSTSKLLQIAPRKALLVVGREEIGGQTLDFAAGVELILVDDHEHIDPVGGMVLTDNEMVENPLTNEAVLMQKFPATGGFIPLGHKSADGVAHPHAGTGFLVLVKHGVPMHVLRGEFNGPNGFDGSWVHDRNLLRQFEVHQIKFDGQRLAVTHSNTFGFKEFLSGHTLFNRGFGAAIPDDDDLLFSMQGGDANLDDRQWATTVGAGAMRWRRGEDGCWRPIDFHPILGDVTGYETSMVRDVDGTLFATARETGKDVPDKFKLLLWRSTDGGRTWELVLERHRARAESPVSLGQAEDGTMFFVGNMLTAPFAGRGTLGYWRDLSAIWPLHADRHHIGIPYIHRCATLEWGPPQSDRGWSVDHLISNRVQLADGQWRTLLCYRAMDRGETAYGSAPTKHTGQYIDEIFSGGPAIDPPWRF